MTTTSRDSGGGGLSSRKDELLRDGADGAGNFDAGDRLAGGHGELQRRLEEAESTIRAIRDGAVDAFVIQEASGQRIFSLETADRPYRLMVEQMQQGAATLFADGTIAWCNRQTGQMLGLSLSRLIGSSLRDFVCDGDHAVYDNLLWQAQSRSGQGEARLRRSDGQVVPVYLTFNALPADSGAAVGVLISDLTTQRHHEELTRAHKSLGHRAEQFQTLLNRTPLGVFVVDADFKLRDINPLALSVLGDTGEVRDIVGRDLGEIMRVAWNQAYADEIVRIFRHTMQTGEPFRAAGRGEMRGNRRTVEYYEWSTDRITLPDGSFGVVCYFRDVSHEIEARRRLEEHSRRLQEVAAAAERIHTATTTDDVLRIVTEQAQRIIGTHQSVSAVSRNPSWAQAIVARSFTEKYEAWHEAELHFDGNGLYESVCASNRPVRLSESELEAHPAYRRAASGPYPPLRGWLAVPLVSRDGRSYGLLQLSDKTDGSDFSADDEAILQQLASIASVAIDNAQLYDGLREADRRKDEFLATLAHELRNPLAPIRNAVELLKARGPGDRDLAWGRDLIDRQVDHLTRLVDDLLDISRISRNKLELRRERIALDEVLRGAVELSRPLIEARGHSLEIDYPDEDVELEADLVRLSQVFMNLLNNAAKYTPDGGRITLSTKPEGDFVSVSIRDNGMGIPRDQIPMLFEMFYQADRSMETTQGGLGIGLALVRRLLELHGGSIECRSDGDGLGSEFVVRLPLPSAPRDPAVRAKEEAREAPARRILVVDDNRDAAESLAMLLQLRGNEVHTVHDGLEAVEAALSFRPDVVLLDIGLPKLNGYEACRRIREQPGGERIVVIAQTGWGQDDDRRQSKDVGFDAHMVKPLDYGALMALLADLPGQRGAP